MEMKKLLEGVQNSQANFVNCLQNRIETTSEKLGWNVIRSLEAESVRNDQKFSKIRRTIAAMHEDVLAVKIFLQAFHKRTLKSSEDEKADNFTQTEYEFKKRVRDGHTKVFF